MNKLFKNFINLSCLLYIISSFILNFLPWLFSKNNQSTMLKIWANFIILLFCMIISTVISCKNRKKEKIISKKASFIFYGCIIYTITFFILNITQYIIQKNNFWNGYTLLIILLFSLVCSLLAYNVKFKSYLTTCIFNFFIIGFFYYIIFVVKAEYSKGNSLIISLGIYFIIFALSAFVYYLLIKKKQKNKNSEKSYKNLFT